MLLSLRVLTLKIEHSMYLASYALYIQGRSLLNIYYLVYPLHTHIKKGMNFKALVIS